MTLKLAGAGARSFAAAAGCALVLGDISSLRETWDGAALFVDPDDPPSLNAAIHALIANPGQRTRLAEPLAGIHPRGRGGSLASFQLPY